jgi:hypothetical protein
MSEKSLMLVKDTQDDRGHDNHDGGVAQFGLGRPSAFLSSPTISPRKMRVLRNGFFMRRNLAGAEGIEPPTNGFGDRYSTN